MLCIFLILAVLGNVDFAFSAEVKTPARGVLIEQIPERYIEVPNPTQPIRYYGQNIRNKLMDVLFRSGKVILIDSQESTSSSNSNMMEFGLRAPDPCLMSGKPEASVRLKISIDQMYFTMGYGPLRQFFGFMKSGENLFNSGLNPDFQNEFSSGKNEFGNAFLDDNSDLHSGLELAHEINFDVVLAGLKIKRVPYYASLGIKLEVQEAFEKKKIYSIETHGDGFFFDFAGHFFYSGADFSLGVGIARETALKDAFDRLVEKLSQDILLQVKESRTLARFTGVCGNQWLLGIGEDFSLKRGDTFYNRTQYEKGFEPDIIVVEQAFNRTSSFSFQRHLAQTPLSTPGDQFVLLHIAEWPPSHLPAYVPPHLSSGKQTPQLPTISLAAQSAETTLQETKTLNAGPKNLPIHPKLAAYQGNFAESFWQTIVNFFTLPYRIYRFFKYNQNYDSSSKKIYFYSELHPKIGNSWKESATDFKQGIYSLLKAYGADKSAESKVFGNKKIVVAIIDSGVDYNNDVLKHSILERMLGSKTVFGWDFFSADSKAYDDHAHGTEVASMIVGNGVDGSTLGFAPNVTLLPLKAFSAYGNTSSAALYTSFEYAVRLGANVIVTAWATEKGSKSLAAGVELARQNNITVVAAAGDLGKDIDLTPAYPAAFSKVADNVIAVGAHDRNYAIAKPKTQAEVDSLIFPSNYGKSVDLFAPGLKLKASRPRDSSHISSHSGLAAGQVAGAIALGMSYCLDKNVKLLPYDFKKALLRGAKEVSGIKALNFPGFVDQITSLCH